MTRCVTYRCLACAAVTPDPFEGTPLRFCSQCESEWVVYHDIV